jgi:hypothetical protein
MTRDKRPQLSGQNKTDLMPNSASCKRWDTLRSDPSATTWVPRRAAAPMAIAPGCGRGHASPQESPAVGEANGAHHGAPRPVHQGGDEGGHAFHDRFPVAFECLEKRFWHVGVDGRRPQPVIQEDGVLSIAVLLLANSLGLYFNAMGQGLWIGQSLAPVDKQILGSRNFKRSYPNGI